MDTMTFILIFSVVLLAVLLIPSDQHSDKKKLLLKTIRLEKRKTRLELFIAKVDDIFYDLLHFDKKDSAQKLIKELIYSALMGLATAIVCAMLNMALIGIIVGTLMLGLPLLIRILNRRENKALYKDSFYRIINYIILYLSGGLNILKAIEETERIIDKKDIIRDNFLTVLKEKKISGISGDNIISSLEALNRDYHLEEIEQFISSLNLANNKGVSIIDALKSQSAFIHRKQLMKVQERIAAADSKVTMLKTLFGIGTAMVIFILPPIVTAILSFSGAL